VDDYFPCIENVPIFSNPVGKDIWTMSLEMVWAKFFGSYAAMEEMSCSDAAVLMLGKPTTTINFNG